MTVTGTFQGRAVTIVIEDGKITEGAHENAAVYARGMVDGGAYVSIPGVWSGTASLGEPVAIAATFSEILDDGSMRIDPPLPESDAPPGAVF